MRMKAEDKKKLEEDESILCMLFSYVKRVKTDRYIVGNKGKYGVVTLNSGVIIPLEYSRITDSEHYFRVYGDVVDKYRVIGVPYDVRENGLINMEGKVIVPMGCFHKTSTVKGFGIGLFNIKESKTVIATNTEKVLRLDVFSEKLEDVGLPGYAALTSEYRNGEHSEFFINNRRVLGVYNTELTRYSSILKCYDRVEILTQNKLFKAYKDNKYTITDMYGMSVDKKWTSIA